MRRNVLALLLSIPVGLFLSGAAFSNVDQVANDDLKVTNDVATQDVLGAEDMNTDVNLDEGNTDQWGGRWGGGGWGRWGGGGWGRWGGFGGWGGGGWGRWGGGGWGGWWPTTSWYWPIYSSWYW